MTKKEAPKPMDSGAREVTNPVPATNNTRDCWAIKTLVAEFTGLFPETNYETSNYDGRNTALDVQFDLTGLPPEDAYNATALLRLLNDPAYNQDPRIREVLVEEVDNLVLVSFHSNPRTQDDREPFGLADAYMVLVDDETGGSL